MTFDPDAHAVRCDEEGCGRTQTLRYVTTGPRLVVLLGWTELLDGLHRCVVCTGESDAHRARAAHLAWGISCANCAIEQVTVSAYRDLTRAETIAVERMSAERAAQTKELAVLIEQLGGAWVIGDEIRELRRRVQERARVHGMKAPKIEMSFGTPRAYGVLKRSRPVLEAAPSDPRRDRLLALAAKILRKDGWIGNVIETDRTEGFEHTGLVPHLTARQLEVIKTIQAEIGECAAELAQAASELATGDPHGDLMVRAAFRVAAACAEGGHDRLEELERSPTLEQDLAAAIGELEAQAMIIKQLAEELEPGEFRVGATRFADGILSTVPPILPSIRQREACRAEYEDAIGALDRACHVERLTRREHAHR